MCIRDRFGAYLYDRFDFKVVQTWLGCILAATVIAFPLMYRNARAAFEQIDANLIYAARTVGMSEIKIFWKVVVPAAGPGLSLIHIEMCIRDRPRQLSADCGLAWRMEPAEYEQKKEQIHTFGIETDQSVELVI